MLQEWYCKAKLGASHTLRFRGPSKCLIITNEASLFFFFHFLYGSFSLQKAKVYLRGNKDFCSTADDDSLVLIGILYPQPNDARSVAVPIIPKTAGKIEIEVTSILEIKEGNKDFWEKREVDAVKRELLVVVSEFKFAEYNYETFCLLYMEGGEILFAFYSSQIKNEKNSVLIQRRYLRNMSA